MTGGLTPSKSFVGTNCAPSSRRPIGTTMPSRWPWMPWLPACLPRPHVSLRQSQRSNVHERSPCGLALPFRARWSYQAIVITQNVSSGCGWETLQTFRFQSDARDSLRIFQFEFGETLDSYHRFNNESNMKKRVTDADLTRGVANGT